LEPFYNPDYALQWLKSKDVHGSSGYGFYGSEDNDIINYCVLLQYSRDFLGDIKAGEILAAMKRWLTKEINPQTGMWG